MTIDNNNENLLEWDDDDDVQVTPPPSFSVPPKLSAPSLSGPSLVDEVSVPDADIVHHDAFESVSGSSILAVTGDEEDPENPDRLAVIQRDVNTGVEQRTVIDFATPELNREGAQMLTENIRTATNVLYILIKRAHAGKAWKALGYSSFKDYVKEEFNMSRSYAYKLLDQATVNEAVQAVTPAGTEVSLSETATRMLKSSLPELVEKIEDRTTGLSPEEAADVVRDTVQEMQDEQKYDAFRESEGGFGDASYSNDSFGDYDGQPRGNGPQNGGEYFPEGGDYQGNANNQPYAQQPSEFDFTESYFDSEEDEGFDVDEVDDAAERVQKLERLYNFITSIRDISEYAEEYNVEELFEILPADREESITELLQIDVTWLTEVQKKWHDFLENKPQAEDIDFNSSDEDKNIF